LRVVDIYFSILSDLIVNWFIVVTGLEMLTLQSPGIQVIYWPSLKNSRMPPNSMRKWKENSPGLNRY